MSPFVGLPLFHYGAIYADPPWEFRNWSPAGEGRNPNQHYPTMPLEEIARLPVGELAAPDCALFLWVSGPSLPEGLAVMKRWGFLYKGYGFIWAKQSKTGRAWHMGPGYWTRANAELCLFGTCGAPKRRSAGVRELVISPLREHSRKPDRIRDDIRRLVPGPYLELFARQQSDGWDVWGNETGKFTAITQQQQGTML